jgi:hypothetical protein
MLPLPWTHSPSKCVNKSEIIDIDSCTGVSFRTKKVILSPLMCDGPEKRRACGSSHHGPPTLHHLKAKVYGVKACEVGHLQERIAAACSEIIRQAAPLSWTGGNVCAFWSAWMVRTLSGSELRHCVWVQTCGTFSTLCQMGWCLAPAYPWLRPPLDTCQWTRSQSEMLRHLTAGCEWICYCVLRPRSWTPVRNKLAWSGLPWRCVLSALKSSCNCLEQKLISLSVVFVDISNMRLSVFSVSQAHVTVSCFSASFSFVFPGNIVNKTTFKWHWKSAEVFGCKSLRVSLM